MSLSTNNPRGAFGRAAPDKANPRANNRSGHIIEVTEANNDAAATTFTWDIFMLAGDPADESTYFAGYPKDKVSPIGAPDNVAFDMAGNLLLCRPKTKDRGPMTCIFGPRSFVFGPLKRTISPIANPQLRPKSCDQ
jgi:secreted PhoX family phosphatase